MVADPRCDCGRGRRLRRRRRIGEAALGSADVRSVLGAAVAGVFVAVAAGCAGMGGANTKSAGPPPMSRAEFARGADRACARDHRAEKRIPNPTNYAALVHGLQRAIPVVEHEIFTLRGLAPPRSDAALFARVLRDLDAQDLAAHRLVDALQAHQVGRARALARQLDALGRRVRRLDRKLGLPACVKAAS
jgi:hypothetical protein